MIQPLRESRQAPFGVADANGKCRATATLGPAMYGTTWYITGMSTNCTIPNPPLPDVSVWLCVYLNVEQPSSLIDSTYSGNLSNSSKKITLNSGETLLFVWTSQSDVGLAAVANINIQGDANNLRR